jgi:hypothetical protein
LAVVRASDRQRRPRFVRQPSGNNACTKPPAARCSSRQNHALPICEQSTFRRSRDDPSVSCRCTPRHGRRACLRLRPREVGFDRHPETDRRVAASRPLNARPKHDNGPQAVVAHTSTARGACRPQASLARSGPTRAYRKHDSAKPTGGRPASGGLTTIEASLPTPRRATGVATPLFEMMALPLRTRHCGRVTEPLHGFAYRHGSQPP